MPLLPHLRRMVDVARLYFQEGCHQGDAFWEDQKDNVWQEHKEALELWHGPFADWQGRSYFVNSSTGLSTMQDPRVEEQFVYDIELQVLDGLRETLTQEEDEAHTP